MIKDSQEYEITKNWVTKFEEASFKVKQSSERVSKTKMENSLLS